MAYLTLKAPWAPLGPRGRTWTWAFALHRRLWRHFPPHRAGAGPEKTWLQIEARPFQRACFYDTSARIWQNIILTAMRRRINPRWKGKKMKQFWLSANELWYVIEAVSSICSRGKKKIVKDCSDGGLCLILPSRHFGVCATQHLWTKAGLLIKSTMEK